MESKMTDKNVTDYDAQAMRRLRVSARYSGEQDDREVAMVSDIADLETTTRSLIEELMGCEHMGDVTKVTRRLAAIIGVRLEGCHDDWSDADWDAIDADNEV